MTFTLYLPTNLVELTGVLVGVYAVYSLVRILRGLGIR
jgi:hypothetical protein